MRVGQSRSPRLQIKLRGEKLALVIPRLCCKSRRRVKVCIVPQLNIHSHTAKHIIMHICIPRKPMSITHSALTFNRASQLNQSSIRLRLLVFMQYLTPACSLINVYLEVRYYVFSAVWLCVYTVHSTCMRMHSVCTSLSPSSIHNSTCTKHRNEYFIVLQKLSLINDSILRP